MRVRSEETRVKDRARASKWAKDNPLRRAITIANYWNKRVEMLRKQEELDESSSETMNN